MNPSDRYPRLAERFGVDLRSLALFRVALGVMILCSVLTAFGDLRAFWSDAGVMPREWLTQFVDPARMSLYLINGQTWFASALLALQGIAALALIVGWRARLTAWLSFALWISLLNRNPMVATGSDAAIAVLLFWAGLLPTSARFAVDAALSTTVPPEAPRHLSWAAAGLTVTVAASYVLSALGSPLGSVPGSGNPTALGAWFAQYGGLHDAAGAGVWWLFAAAWLLVPPLWPGAVRLLVLGLLCLAQLGHWLLLDDGSAALTAIIALAALLPPLFWQRLGAARTDDAGLTIYFDRDCAFCHKACLLLRQCLVLGDTRILAAQDSARTRTLMEANHSWVVIDADEQAHLKWPAFVALLKHSPLFGWLWRWLRSPRLEPAGNRLYDFVARHRGRFGAATAFLSFRRVRWSPSTPEHATAILITLLVVAGQLQAAGGATAHQSGVLTQPLRTLNLEAALIRTTPTMSTTHGRLLVSGRTTAGTEIDVFDPQARAPDYGTATGHAPGGARWRHYLERLLESGHAEQRPYLAAYLCRHWREGEQLLQNVRLIEIRPRPMSAGGASAAAAEQRILLRHDCTGPSAPSDTP